VAIVKYIVINVRENRGGNGKLTIHWTGRQKDRPRKNKNKNKQQKKKPR
jgi:hypothetical protein